MVGGNLLQGKNDYSDDDGGIFYRLFLAPKSKILFDYKWIWISWRT